MSKRFVQRKYTAPEYILSAMENLKPPENLTVSQWAEKYRILDERSSHMPGPWRNDMTPYLADIMNEFNNPDTEEIIFVKPTQVGGTEAIQNMIGYVVSQDPAPAMIVYPTDTLAESVSATRLMPMIKASPMLRKKFNLKASQKQELQFDNMYISLAGSNSPSGLASKPIRFLFLDEVDKYPSATKKEADPISLARERTKTFANRKIYMCSTPTLRTGHIWKAKEAADMEKHFFVPCPHCGEYIELKFEQIKWPPRESGLSDLDRTEFANYVCQNCGGVISDNQKNIALKNGEWRVVKRNTQFSRKVCYWINTLYSPFTRFSEIAKNFVLSKEDPDMLHNFANSWLAEPWEDTRTKTDAETVLKRQTDTEMWELPVWTKMLTGGIDVQHGCVYWTIRAWGDYLTSQNIAHGQAQSLYDTERIMNLEFKKADGETMLVQLVLVDSGDQTDDVYDFCSYNAEWALPCKGASGAMLSHYRLSTVNKAGSKANGMTLVIVDGGKYKDMIMSRVTRPNGKGSWQVYKGCDMEYAQQVTAEQKVADKNGARWVPKRTHGDNHYLDAEVYAFAAADVLGVRNLFLNETGKPETEYAHEAISDKEEQWIQENDSWL